MSDRCRELRLCLWAGGDEPELAAHLASCEACAALARGRERLARALGSLPRLAVPRALEGAVVAELHAGRREQRAVRSLERVTRRVAPPELARRLDAELPHGLAAPTVLERLVDEDLREPQRALSERFLRKLERLSAPAELEARVTLALTRRAPRARRGLAALGAALAVVLLVWAAEPWSARTAPSEPGLRIELVQARSLAEFGATTRALVDGLSGGLLSAADVGGEKGVPR